MGAGILVMALAALGIAADPASAQPAPAQPMPTTEPSAAPVVVVEIAVQDRRGRPITDLRPREVEVLQGGGGERLLALNPARAKGHYEVRYSPQSGQAGAVQIRVRRLGASVRGPRGAFLEPRVINALSPLESELVRALEARPSASDLECESAVLRLGPTPNGGRYAVALEVVLSELLFDAAAGSRQAHLQLLARIKSDAKPAAQLVTLDRVLAAPYGGDLRAQHLVWTATVELAPDRYAAETLVRDATTQKATTRVLRFEVPAATPALRVSSVVLLQPEDFFFSRETTDADPFVFRDEHLMPSLRPEKRTKGEKQSLRFYLAVYPDPRSAEPISLVAEVHRDGAKVGEAPLVLPPPEKDTGEVRYVGSLLTGTFREASYLLRLVARQGDQTASDEAPFEIVDRNRPTAGPTPPPVRFPPAP